MAPRLWPRHEGNAEAPPFGTGHCMTGLFRNLHAPANPLSSQSEIFRVYESVSHTHRFTLRMKTASPENAAFGLPRRFHRRAA